MLIHLVEDDNQKSDLITDHLMESLDDINIWRFSNYHSGLSAILKKSPDLILLDMTLPNFGDIRSGKKREFGGYEIMRKLKLREHSFSAIVITQYENFEDSNLRKSYSEMTSMCTSEFKANFLGSVRYSSVNQHWKSDLIKLIRKAKKKLVTKDA